MAFEKDRHTFDTKTGYMMDKVTGQIAGQHEEAVKKMDDVGNEYPKWVSPHPSWVTTEHGNVVVPAWPEFYVDRVSKAPFVLVHDEVEEQKVVGGKDQPRKKPELVRPTEPLRGQD